MPMSSEGPKRGDNVSFWLERRLEAMLQDESVDYESIAVTVLKQIIAEYHYCADAFTTLPTTTLEARTLYTDAWLA